MNSSHELTPGTAEHEAALRSELSKLTPILKTDDAFWKDTYAGMISDGTTRTTPLVEICVCGHPKGAHSAHSKDAGRRNNHATHPQFDNCTPSKYTCMCRGHIPALKIKDPRPFVRKHGGSKAAHALSRGLFGMYKAYGDALRAGDTDKSDRIKANMDSLVWVENSAKFGGKRCWECKTTKRALAPALTRNGSIIVLLDEKNYDPLASRDIVSVMLCQPCYDRAIGLPEEPTGENDYEDRDEDELGVPQATPPVPEPAREEPRVIPVPLPKWVPEAPGSGEGGSGGVGVDYAEEPTGNPLALGKWNPGDAPY